MRRRAFSIMWYIYILFCKGGSYYTGCTNNIKQRIKDHLRGKGGRYTRSHKPEKLVYSETQPTRSAALKREAQIKKWTRAKKEALISGNLSFIKNLNLSKIEL